MTFKDEFINFLISVSNRDWETTEKYLEKDLPINILLPNKLPIHSFYEFKKSQEEFFNNPNNSFDYIIIDIKEWDEYAFAITHNKIKLDSNNTDYIHLQICFLFKKISNNWKLVFNQNSILPIESKLQKRQENDKLFEANITSEMTEKKTTRGIYYRDWSPNSSKPPLVLVRGYSGSSDSWHKPFLDFLANNFRIIIFDNRGTGRSIKPKYVCDYSIATMAEDLKSVVNDLGLKKFNLLGFSMGGCIAHEYAHLYPDDLLAMTLLSTHAGGKSYVLPNEINRLRMLQRPSGKTLLDKAICMWEACNTKESVEKHIDELKQSIDTNPENLTSIDAMNGQMAAYLAFDRDDEVSFKFPILVCTGDNDLITPLQNSINLSNVIKNSELKIIENCGHLVDFEKPKISASLFTEFFMIS